MLHLPHVLRLFMHPHHGVAGDVLAGSVELCAESVEMEDMLPRGYHDVRRNNLPDERETKRIYVVRGNRRMQLAPIATGLAMRPTRMAAREEGLTPRRSCKMIWRDSWI